jgi:hypothetical protein
MTVTRIVLRWKGFEWPMEREEPHHDRIEITLGEHITDKVGAAFSEDPPKWITLWAFLFKEIDGEGRRIYEAEGDPYEDIVERYKYLEAARWIEEHKDEKAEVPAPAFLSFS